MDPMNVGTSIRELRERAGLTQTALADILGKAQSSVACWERGRSKPRLDDLPAVAAALGCGIEDIVKGGAQNVAG